MLKSKFFNLRAQEEKNLDLSRFESLGDNCEFGFFLKQAGVEISSFFRWVLITDYAKVLELIKNDFPSPFNIYHLKPFQDYMVMNIKNGIGYHSEMQSCMKDNRRIFCISQDRKKAVYLHEINKINHLKIKFLNTIKEGNKIFVVKKDNNEQEKQIKLIAKEIASKGSCKVLRIISTSDRKKLGCVKKITRNLYYGYIDRFADYSKADDFSYECWMAILKEANRKIL
ncbi:hypothetical protein P88_00300 [Erwinia phage phiEt88]|uniref:hypothetical protein n=1 Tax=Erwinia phage phiEt88 TaxID=925984 RepID=UPI0001F1FC6E|nr:hypothetical protein ErPhphiEt88_gp30 [Erwinia phage phiEt88]CBX44541.1 hypothetical protein P88_00300 [Erwinia phage phiEt88]